MAIKIGIVNQKGGVGKTTTAICLTDALTQIGYKTLIVDFDPQANVTSVFRAKDRDKTITNAIKNELPFKDIIVKGNTMGDIAPSNEDLADAQESLILEKDGKLKLREVLSTVDEDYDIIVVDSGPTRGIMMYNILAAVDGVVIPMEAETFAIEGLVNLLNNIENAKETLNPDLKVYGVLLSNFKKGISTQNKINAQFSGIDESIVHTFKTIIRESGAIPSTQGWYNVEQATTWNDKKIMESEGSIYKYGTNNGAIDYSEFAKELLEVIANG